MFSSFKDIFQLFIVLVFTGIFFFSTSITLALDDHIHDHRTLNTFHDSHEVSGLDSLYFSMEMITLVWVFAFAASIGSFLNVVIYRMPLNMNLSHPKSHCPNCKTEISVWDNIPILGWIKLRGKCRNCQCSISPRYPLVEAAVGCIVVSIFLGELLRGCCNLPFHSYAHHTHSFMSDIVWELRVDLILISIIHAYLIVILLVFALISMDERAVPHRLIQRSMIFVFLTGVIFSDIYPLPFHEPFDYDHGMFRLSELKNPWPANYEKDYLDPHWNIIGESIINLLLGMFIGMLLSVIWKFRDQHTWSIPKLFGMQSMMLLTGAYLGWQAVIMIFSTYQFLRLLIETLGLFRTKIPAYMTHQLGFVLLTLLFILNWNTCWNLIGATHSS